MVVSISCLSFFLAKKKQKAESQQTFSTRSQRMARCCDGPPAGIRFVFIFLKLWPVRFSIFEKGGGRKENVLVPSLSATGRLASGIRTFLGRQPDQKICRQTDRKDQSLDFFVLLGQAKRTLKLVLE